MKIKHSALLVIRIIEEYCIRSYALNTDVIELENVIKIILEENTAVHTTTSFE
jgi:hypothetical protein